MNGKKVTVIIPVYNVEAYIERCARSLYEQSYQYIEYIWINDATPDRSIDLLNVITREYPHRQLDVHILDYSINMGPQVARNIGISFASGDYIFQCDADDWADKGMIESLVNHAEKEQADIVWCDFYKTYSHREVIISQKYRPHNMECIRNLLSEKMHGGYWNKLIRKGLYDENRITFSEKANICEDLRGSIQLFYYARKVSYYPKAFYHYVQDNVASLSANITHEKHLELFVNIDAILTFLEEKQLTVEFAKDINYLKLLAKRPYLISTDRVTVMKWRDVYPEANLSILSYLALPISLRILGWFISKGWWLPVQAYLTLKSKVHEFNKILSRKKKNK